MADLFLKSRKDELAEIAAWLLKYAAWYVAPIPYRALSAMATKMGVKPGEIKKLVAQVCELGTMQVNDQLMQNDPNAVFCIPVDLHLQLLWELKEVHPDTLKLFQSINFYHYYSGTIGLWRELLLNYVRTGRVSTMPEYIDKENIILGLCKGMVDHPHWKELFFSLPGSLYSYLYNEEYSRCEDDLEIPDSDFMQKVFLENKKVSASMKRFYRDCFSFSTYVLSGRIQEIPRSVTLNESLGLCAHALYYQYQGNYKEALVHYREALKKGSDFFFYQPFYDMTYVLALLSDDGVESKKKITALAKKKELQQETLLLPAHLLILNSQHADTTGIILQFLREYTQMTPLLKALMLLLIKHYHLTEDTTFLSREANWAQQLVSGSHLKLLQLEYSQDFPMQMTQADALKQELGLVPLLPPFKKLTEWEKSIEILMDLTQGKKGSDSNEVKAEAQSRIIYHIDQSEQIIPRLQKSKDGITWSKGRNIALTTFKQQGVAEMTEVDRRLSACVRTYAGGWGVGEFSELNGANAFAALAGYPLVFQAENPDVPIVITKDEPQLVVTKAPGGYRVNINAAPPFDAAVVVKKENDQLYRVLELTALQRKILEVIQRVSYYPVTAKVQLSELLSRLSRSITVHSDLLQSDEKLKTVKGDTLITVQLQPMGDGIKAELFVKPFIEQPPYCKAGEGASGVIGVVNGKRVQAVRDLKKEQSNYEIISRLLQKVSGDKTATDVIFFDDHYQCMELIDSLREQTKTARTEWPEGVKFVINRSADFSQLHLSLKGVGQWFEVEGELKIDARTKIKIGELLQKVRQSKGRFIALGDSEFLALSLQLRRQLEEMDALLLSDKKKLQLSHLNSSSIAEMEQMGITLTKDQVFTDLQKRMEEAGQSKYTIPKTLQAELRSYQEDGFRWMSRLAHWGAGACLADDMGLGKTVQSIALLLSRAKQGASLVIAPASVMLNWKVEIERFAPSLTAHVMHDADGNREQLIDNANQFDVVLTTYGLLIKESELLAHKKWNVIVLDEAHTIKNKETKMSKAAMELQAEFRLLLTGTPLQNHLGEIWNLFQFANPGLLGSFQHFNDTFILPIEKGADKQRQQQLKKILQPFLLRRTKTQVLDELPEKTEITLSVELSDEERALYENIREQAVLNLEESSTSAMQALAEITRLRQAACHPALVNKQLTIASSKTQAFLKLTDELMNNNHRALVFSQFTSHLALIRKELDERGIDYLYLDGSISVAERATLVKAFQTGEQPLFLISLKAGGTGLNLTAADYVIHLDPWWNPAVEDQASDRAHRIGQTRPVTIYRLISTQTIEEKIIQLHQSKKSLADSLLDGSDMAHKLTKEEMLALLRGADY